MTEKSKTVEISEEELAKLKTDLAKANEEAAKSLKALADLRKKKEKQTSKPKPPPVTEHEEPPIIPKEESHGHEEGKPHYVGAWQQFCPTCGDKNPDFKDETTCDDCGMHLGAKDVAVKLKACPNCGGHKASVIKK